LRDIANHYSARPQVKFNDVLRNARNCLHISDLGTL
jgi:hypothetical protein